MDRRGMQGPVVLVLVRPWGYLLHLCPRRASKNSLMVMLMPPYFVNGLFNVFRPDIGCIASSFLICCPLPENHMYQQEVVRFCQGAADKEAGSYASNIRPKNIEEAIDEIRWHQHNHQAI
jgi:hypothetical protein